MVSMSDQRGMSESVQLAVLLPLLIGIFLLLLQWALISWAQSTATSAAQESAAAAALHGARAADGLAVGERALSNGSLSRASVRVEKGATITRSVVRGRAVAVLFPYEVVAEATSPTERVTVP